MLHSTYFGTLQALRREEGFFSICELAVEGIDDMLKAYFNFLEAEDLADILEHLEKTGIYRDLELKQEGDRYLLKIGKCLFAGGEEGAHKKIKEIDLPCPISLFVSSYLAKQNPSKRVYAYPSI